VSRIREQVRGVFLLAVVAAAGVSPADAAEDVARTPAEAAQAFLRAYRAQDAAAMEEVALDPRIDPFRVAFELFAGSAETAPSDATTTDLLEAAEALALRAKARKGAEGLGEAVRRQRSVPTEGVQPVFAILRKVRASEASGDVEKGRVAVAEWNRVALPLTGDLVSVVCGAAIARWYEGTANEEGEAARVWGEVARAAGEGHWPAMRATALEGEAAAASMIGRLARSLAARQEERAVRLSIGDRRGAAAALYRSGGVLARLGELGKAADAFDRARVEAVEALDPALAARTVAGLAEVRGRVARFSEALSLFEQALTEQKRLGDARAQVETMTQLGDLLARMHDVPRAIDWKERALAAAAAMGDPRDVYRTRFDLGLFLMRGGRHEEARVALETAQKEMTAAGDRQAAAYAMSAIAEARSKLGDPNAAVPLYLEALEALEALGDRQAAARIRGSLADTYALLGRPDDAKAALHRTIEEGRSTGERELVALAYGNLGVHHFDLGERNAARAMFEKAIAEWEAFGDRGMVASNLYRLARVDGDFGDRPVQAMKGIKKAIRIWLALGSGLAETEAEGTLDRTHAAIDVGLAAATWALRFQPARKVAVSEDSFWLMEAGRGLLLSQAVSDRRGLLLAHVPRELAEAEVAARARVEDRLADLRSRPTAGTPPSPESVAARRAVDAAYDDLDAAVASIRRAARRAGDVVFPQPRALADVRAAIADDTALLLYQVGAGVVTALVVRKGDVFQHVVGTEAEFLASAEAYMQLSDPAATEETRLAARLYDVLLRPLEPALSGTTRLLVAPDGVLHFLPFGALIDGSAGERRRACDRWEIGYVPSGTVLSILLEDVRGVAPGTGLVAVGDPVYPGEPTPLGTPVVARRDAEIRGLANLPRLPATGDEVAAVGAMVPPDRRKILVRGGATVAALRSALAARTGRLRALHLACHGHLDVERPRLSGLILSGGEILSMDDVYRLDAAADLVVLSACETGKGRIVRGEGISGLVRAFMYAGAPRVMASLWNVDDAATRLLMEAFYDGWLRRGLGAAAALRAAQRTVREHVVSVVDPEASRAAGKDVLKQTRPFAAPRYWAGWALWGLPD
jgi:CHAT domain-containing protein/tetratricopeptide (TPR) repeat protein